MNESVKKKAERDKEEEEERMKWSKERRDGKQSNAVKNEKEESN